MLCTKESDSYQEVNSVRSPPSEHPAHRPLLLRTSCHSLRLNEIQQRNELPHFEVIITAMSAERIQLEDEVAPVHTESEPANEPFALREQVAQRLAAHRTAGDPISQPATTHPARAILAARVAERYAQSQSYRAFLAEEAERAVRQAEAAAEVARRNADAVAAAQY